MLNLLVATDGAVAAFGADVRRLRPNLLISGVPADAEATWPGHALAIGDALIGIHSVRQRCIVTTIDPDTGQPISRSSAASGSGSATNSPSTAGSSSPARSTKGNPPTSSPPTSIRPTSAVGSSGAPYLNSPPEPDHGLPGMMLVKDLIAGCGLRDDSSNAAPLSHTAFAPPMAAGDVSEALRGVL